MRARPHRAAFDRTPWVSIAPGRRLLEASCRLWPVLYQAIGYLVPLIGGGIAYVFLRREFGPMSTSGDEAPAGA